MWTIASTRQGRNNQGIISRGIRLPSGRHGQKRGGLCTLDRSLPKASWSQQMHPISALPYPDPRVTARNKAEAAGDYPMPTMAEKKKQIQAIQDRWETLSVQQDSCLWWRVRVADTAPNAPNEWPKSEPFLSPSACPGKGSGRRMYAGAFKLETSLWTPRLLPGVISGYPVVHPPACE